MSSSSELSCCELDDEKSPFSWDFSACKSLNYSLDRLCRLSDCGDRSDGGCWVGIVEAIDRRSCGYGEQQLMEA